MSGVVWPRLRRNLVAILRGIGNADIESVGAALVERGFEAIEVPLNSPDPFTSIEKLARLVPGHVLVGAGTVTSSAQILSLRDAGGRLVVSPNMDPAVVSAAAACGMVTMPGVLSPTEALAAVVAGASALKFFPADIPGPGGIKAIRAILPPETVIGAVGGVGEQSFPAYLNAGVTVFGMGTSLYSPGDAAEVVSGRALRIIESYDNAKAADGG